MLRILIVSIILFLFGFVNAQSCLSEGITFMSQREIDDFSKKYTGCTNIEGDLIIYGDEIINMIGLSQLKSIGGTLFIMNNSRLINLKGMQNILSIEGSLSIYQVSAIKDLEGFDKLNLVGKSLAISENESLIDLKGFNNLTNINSGILISNNMNLTDIKVLQNIDIKKNKSENGRRDVEIHGNPKLSSCAISSVCDAIILHGATTEIFENGIGCNSDIEIKTSCKKKN